MRKPATAVAATSKLPVAELLKNETGKIAESGFREASYAGSFEEAVENAVARAEPGDMILTLGAGSVSQLGPMVLEKLELTQTSRVPTK